MSTIVVGVDDSAGARRALEFALEEARLRDASLKVVYAWLLPLPVVIPGPVLAGIPVESGPALEEEIEQARQSAERLLEAVIEQLPTEGVRIERLAVEGQPAKALLDTAADADLLVVGSRGRGGFKGLVMGSVSQQCANHAPCPVVIVPAGASEAS